MPSEYGLEEHRTLVKSLTEALEAAEKLGLDDMAESIGDDLAEAEQL